MGCQKIKSNAVCKVEQLKQVHLSLLVTFLFFPSGVTRNGLHSMQLCCHISSLRPTYHLFLCNQKWLLNLHKCPLALVNLYNQMNPNLCLLSCLHIQRTIHCLFERQRLIGSPEVAGCLICLSIPLLSSKKRTLYFHHISSEKNYDMQAIKRNKSSRQLSWFIPLYSFMDFL